METLAATCLTCGKDEEALAAAEEGLEMVAQSGERGTEAELLFCKGKRYDE
jgi:hypothetical protein